MQFEDALSTERLSTYMAWASQDSDVAKRLYGLNVALSEALYTPLHVLEITLRNGVHRQMVAVHGNGWFANNQLISDLYQQRRVQDAYQRFGQGAPDGKIVAELTFGFWTALFTPRNSTLWGDLHPIFNSPVQRRPISRRLQAIRTLRNRIAHHEVIIKDDLLTTHQEMREIIGWLSADALVWCDERCRFQAIHPQMPIIVGNLKNPALQF
ncbi:MAG: hypothetical protein AAFR02_01075 [Pseudomonadota bacterium]